jgi:hypothetical protein
MPKKKDKDILFAKPLCFYTNSVLLQKQKLWFLAKQNTNFFCISLFQNNLQEKPHGPKKIL